MSTINRCPYGGVTTDVNSLAIGTHFWVHNGAWYGEIITLNDQKYVRVKDANDKFVTNVPLTDPYELDISIVEPETLKPKGDSYFSQQVDAHNITDPVELLNWYRNLYYKEEPDTERRIMAEAINKFFYENRDKLKSVGLL